MPLNGAPRLNFEQVDEDEEIVSEQVDTSKGIKMDTINETGGEQDDDEEDHSDEDVVLFVESKYCTVCHME